MVKALAKGRGLTNVSLETTVNSKKNYVLQFLTQRDINS
jgi:hypothetical protein